MLHPVQGTLHGRAERRNDDTEIQLFPFLSDHARADVLLDVDAGRTGPKPLPQRTLMPQHMPRRVKPPAARANEGNAGGAWHRCQNPTHCDKSNPSEQETGTLDRHCNAVLYAPSSEPFNHLGTSERMLELWLRGARGGVGGGSTILPAGCSRTTIPRVPKHLVVCTLTHDSQPFPAQVSSEDQESGIEIPSCRRKRRG